MASLDPVLSLRSLADPTRLAVARLLVESAFNVGEIQEVLGLGQSTTSHHLKILADAGLMSCRREGRLAYYQWEPSLAPAGEALRLFVRDHAPLLDPHARRRLHRVFEARADRTRRFFNGAAAEALVSGQASERTMHVGVDVIDPIISQVPQGAVVVDLGTGGGRLLGPLLTRARHVIGIDASPRMLERASDLAREHRWDEVELRLGTLEHLPVRDGEADAAIAHMVLHHAAVPETALAEARRAIKPGGWLIVGDFLPHDQEWMREELADQWLGFDPDMMGRMLSDAGFDQVQVRPYAASRPGELGMFVAAGRRTVNSVAVKLPAANEGPLLDAAPLPAQERSRPSGTSDQQPMPVASHGTRRTARGRR